MTTTETSDPSTTGLPPGRWVIEPAHSEVGFTIRHLGLSRIRGQFKTFTGSVEVSGEFAGAAVEAAIDLGSVDTNNEQRDGHLLSSDFFDVDTNPKMTFRSTAISVEPNGSQGTIIGELTIAGTTRTVELDTEFNGVATDAYGATRAGFSATTTLSRKDFGIDFNIPLDAGGFVLGDKVSVELEVQLVAAQD